ncbi:MAG: hypothetical protein ABIP97_09045 [Chthoniobacterales bacterium]
MKLRRLVDGNTRRWKALIILEALGVTIAVPTGYFLLAVLLDNVVHLPVWGRLTISAVFFATLIGFVTWLARQWRQARFTEDQVALAMEKQTPGVQNRLINALQISRQEATDLNQEVVYDNYQRLKRIEIQQAIRIRPAIIRLTVAAVIVCAGLTFWGFQPKVFTSAATRIMNPFAKITPVYRTILTIYPGNTQCAPGEDAIIRIDITGEHPAELTITRFSGELRSNETIAIEKNATSVSYAFKNLQRSLNYTVHGGDFTSDIYMIDVPTPPQINLVRSQYHYPEYTKLPDQKIESAGGDMEALYNTRAKLTFILDKPAEKAFLLLGKVVTPAQNKDTAPSIQHIELKKVGASEFTGEIIFADVIDYQIETQNAGQLPRRTASYGLRILADHSPSLTLTGLERNTEAQIGSALPIKIAAEDDYGLSNLGLYYRKADGGSDQVSIRPATSASAKTEDSWQQITAWKAEDSGLYFQADYTLPIASLNATEGDQIQIRLRAQDNDPLKAEQWTTGETYTLLIGGEGVALQVLYEHILQTEADIRALLAAQHLAASKTAEWNQKLDPTSGLRWDDKTNLDALANAMREQARAQEEQRAKMGHTARNIVEQSSSLRLPLGLLADMEVTHSISILESVSGRDTPQEMRTALADGKLTMERTSRSLNEILGQYVKFRKDWELSNTTSFVKMLADRQTALLEECKSYKEKPPTGANATLLQKSVSQRQAKLLQLSNLTQVALSGIADRILLTKEAILGKAYAEASSAFDRSGLKTQMQLAGSATAAGHWAESLSGESKAAEELANIHFLLKKAAIEAAQRAKDVDKKSPKKSEIAAQQPILSGTSGPANPPLTGDPKITSIVHTLETHPKGTQTPGEQNNSDPTNLLEKYIQSITAQSSNAKMPEASQFSGAQTPGSNAFVHKTPTPPGDPNIIAKITAPSADVKAPMLKDVDELIKGFQTLQTNTSTLGHDTGPIGKTGGDANSFSPVARTGNQAPPPISAGGMSQTGRDTGLSTGLNAGSESSTSKGREKPLEGVNSIADQSGKLKAHDDKQSDPSTGDGGEKIDSKNTKFSSSDTSAFNPDKSLKNMGDPQVVYTVVERKGAPLDPNAAAMMRDLKSRQLQLIERSKIIKKELQNLYLPTEPFEALITQLMDNTNRMTTSPDGKFFRDQLQALNQLRQKVQVFNEARSNFQSSLARVQEVKGHVLDQSASQTSSNYENSVKDYFEKLSAQ